MPDTALAGGTRLRMSEGSPSPKRRMWTRQFLLLIVLDDRCTAKHPFHREPASEPRHEARRVDSAARQASDTLARFLETRDAAAQNKIPSPEHMERLLAKMGTPSYLPSPAEVIDGVRWLRENPALAAGVVVGLTSYSMAKYYEYNDEDEPDAEDNEAAAATHEPKLTARATREEIARSVSALQLGLLKVHVRGSARENSTASTESSGSSSGLRSRASSIFDRVHFEEPAFPDHAVNPARSCVHGGECPPDKPCCDPDWGWFVPTSPTQRRLAK